MAYVIQHQQTKKFYVRFRSNDTFPSLSACSWPNPQSYKRLVWADTVGSATTYQVAFQGAKKCLEDLKSNFYGLQHFLSHFDETVEVVEILQVVKTPDFAILADWLEEQGKQELAKTLRGDLVTSPDLRKFLAGSQTK